MICLVEVCATRIVNNNLPEFYQLFAEIGNPDEFVPNPNNQGQPQAVLADNIGNVIYNELVSYRTEPALPMLNPVSNKWNIPLDWWRQHKRRYPTISALARRILCIPATSAPSKRLFSVAGLTIANNRARMHGDVAAAQIFLHDAYPVVNLYQLRRRQRENEEE